MGKELEKLINRIGEKILYLQIEEFIISVDKQISNVWLKLSFGKPFVFGCSGDGSVYIKKSDPKKYSYKDESNSFKNITEFYNSKLEGVVIEGEKLILQTTEGSIEIINEDDELLVNITYNKSLERDGAKRRAAPQL